jgi:hypothetical protein
VGAPRRHLSTSLPAQARLTSTREKRNESRERTLHLHLQPCGGGGEAPAGCVDCPSGRGGQGRVSRTRCTPSAPYRLGGFLCARCVCTLRRAPCAAAATAVSPASSLASGWRPLYGYVSGCKGAHWYLSRMSVKSLNRLRSLCGVCPNTDCAFTISPCTRTPASG